jgi:hypothetical protein
MTGVFSPIRISGRTFGTAANIYFLSTFSGTHYVTPGTFTGEIGFHF